MPLPVLTIAQMRDWEKATWATGQTEAEVIRRVGERVAERALQLTTPGELLLILAGKGHNGDDACLAREHLVRRRVDVLNVHDPAADAAKLEALLSLRPALIIDGLFGIGLNRPLSREWTLFIQKVNEARVPVLAVDVPSGLNSETGEPEDAAVQASITLTVGAPKTGMLRESAWPFVGRLEVAQDVGLIGCPHQTELQWTLADDFREFPPHRSAATHKGTYGHLGIIAGSLGYHGAAVLAARGAQRAQPGLVTLYTMEPVYQVVAAQLQAVMVSPWNPGDNLPDTCSALMTGPGLAAQSLPPQLPGVVAELWRQSELPMVVDASALQWLPKGPVSTTAPRVITPHPGEAARMLGSSSKEVQADRLGALRELSKTFGNTYVVLKGHQTLVGASKEQVFVNSSGNPHLAQGGSGDVLSGYVGGLLAQPGLAADPMMALRYAAWQHGATADHLQATRQGWVVEDLVAALGSKQGS
jgi:NAD(P)H-hydrate epimerase